MPETKVTAPGKAFFRFKHHTTLPRFRTPDCFEMMTASFYEGVKVDMLFCDQCGQGAYIPLDTRCDCGGVYGR